MKFLIMTEGTCEKALLDVLIEKKLLKYDIDDLFYRQVFHSRQISTKIVSMIYQMSDNEITIIRVGDKLSDNLKIPKDIKDRIKGIINICTKPELEILHIIEMNQFDEYMKVKSKQKPCEFLKKINKKYKKSYASHYNYFSKMNKTELAKLFNQYDKKRKKTHTKNTMTINSLIRKEN